MADQLSRSRPGAARWLVVSAIAILGRLLPDTSLLAQVTVSVPAKQEWVDTRLEVVQGDRLVFRERGGSWSNVLSGSFGPKGSGSLWQGTQLDKAPLGALIGRVQRSMFLAPLDNAEPAPETGRLFLGMNDVPGTYEDNSGQVVIFVSSVPLRMPDLRGLEIEEASRTLRDFHRVPQVQGGPSELARGVVYDQEPSPGTELRPDSAIVLQVSDGSRPPEPSGPTAVPMLDKPPEISGPTALPPVPMPDFYNHSLTEAVETLRSLRRKPHVDWGASKIARGRIYGQRPPPDTDLAGVKEIFLQVSNGPTRQPPLFGGTNGRPPFGTIALLAIVAVTTIAAAKAIRHSRWKRLCRVKPSLDLSGASSTGPMTMTAPPIAIQVRLEPGAASPIGSVLVKAIEEDS